MSIIKGYQILSKMLKKPTRKGFKAPWKVASKKIKSLKRSFGPLDREFR